MRKFILVFFSCVILIMLTSCQKNNKTNTNTDEYLTPESNEYEENIFDIKYRKAIAVLDEYSTVLDDSGLYGIYLELAKKIIENERNSISIAYSNEDTRNIGLSVERVRRDIPLIKFIRYNNSKYNMESNAFNGCEQFTIGSGTENDPFIINTPMELLYLSKETYFGNSDGVYYALGSDIDLKGTYWVPIGYIARNDSFSLIYDSYYGHAFKGHFDGRGHVIKNLRVMETDYYYYTSLRFLVGLFGGNEGEIKNVSLDNFVIDIYSFYAFGKNSSLEIGSICAINNGTISNCYSSGLIRLKCDDTAYYDRYLSPNIFEIGKIASYNDENGTISNCIANVDIDVDIQFKRFRDDGPRGNAIISNIALGDGICNNCLTVGSLNTIGVCEVVDNINSFNCYTYIDELNSNNTCTKEDLNNSYFYINTLGLNPEIWDLENIIFENNAYMKDNKPILKNIGND